MSQLKEYKAIIWPKHDEDALGVRVTVWAEDADQALQQILEEHGDNIIYTLRNDEDENKLR